MAPCGGLMSEHWKLSVVVTGVVLVAVQLSPFAALAPHLALTSLMVLAALSMGKATLRPVPVPVRRHERRPRR